MDLDLFGRTRIYNPRLQLKQNSAVTLSILQTMLGEQEKTAEKQRTDEKRVPQKEKESTRLAKGMSLVGRREQAMLEGKELTC